MQRCYGLDERDQERIVHELVDDAARFFQFRGMRRGRTSVQREKAVANSSGNVDLARRARNNVNLHELLPRGTDPFGGFGGGSMLGQVLVIEGGVSLRVERKL